MDASTKLAAAFNGRYVIEKQAGVGGMATVYVARDLRHDRRVALKVLHPDLAAALGTDRFLAEIKTTANLQHPHILPLHDSGEADGFLYYVMPYVEGETLRARLEREQQLPIDDAVRISKEVLSALDYAHRRGVVHRDIKPENILLHDGSALVADFGIALAVTAAGGQRMTQTGLSLGTPQYMSPEQAMGERHIDGRSDIYAVGAVLYEMLTGEPPFTGTTVQAIVAKVLTEHPTRPSIVRDTVPPHVEAAVEKALAKLPADRFASAAQFAEAMSHESVSPYVTSARTGARVVPSRHRRALAALSAVAVVLGVAAIVGWWKATHPSVGDPVRFTLSLESNEILAVPQGLSLAVSPDGRAVAYLASGGAGRLVYVRKLAEARAHAIPGTDGAFDVRFSPDGKTVTWWAGDERRAGVFKVSVDGGPTTFVHPTSWAWQGSSWGNAEPIVYSDGTKLLSLGSRGPPKVIVELDRAAGENNPGDPYVLPDGKNVVFRLDTRVGRRLGLGSVAGGKHTVLDLEGSNAITYVDGWLVFGRNDGSIAAARVDLASGRVTSDVVPVMDRVRARLGGGLAAAVSRSGGGTAAFLRGSPVAALQVIDEHGNTIFAAPQRLNFSYPAWSPDGQRIALTIQGYSTGRLATEMWVYDVSSKVLSRLTADDAQRTVWSPDGKHVAYLKWGRQGIYWTSVDGSTGEEQLSADRFREISFARDGRLFAAKFDSAAPDQRRSGSVWVMSVVGDRTPRRVIGGLSEISAATVSPDGRLLAYQENVTSDEVYVLSLATGSRAQVSSAGGTEPRWSADGRRLFYRSRGGAFMAATVMAANGSISIASRDSLFPDRYALHDEVHPYYDGHPDGKRFVVIDEDLGQARVEVVVNWLTELRAKLK